MKLRDMMSTHLATVHKCSTVREAVQVMKTFQVRHLLVLDSDWFLVGLLTDRDLRLISPSGSMERDYLDKGVMKEKVRKCMVKDPMTATPDQDVNAAAQTLVNHRIGCLPVVGDDYRPLGIVTRGDFLRSLSVEKNQAWSRLKSSELTKV